MEPVFLAINALGLLGFAIILLSTRMKTRPGFLIADMTGNGIAGLHYVFLGGAAGVLFCWAYSLFDLAALKLGKAGLSALGTLLGGACLILLFLNPGWADLVAVIGSVVAVASRLQTDMRWILLLAALSSVFWATYGLLFGSWPQVGFSCTYIVLSLIGAWRAHKAMAAAV